MIEAKILEKKGGAITALINGEMHFRLCDSLQPLVRQMPLLDWQRDCLPSIVQQLFIEKHPEIAVKATTGSKAGNWWAPHSAADKVIEFLLDPTIIPEAEALFRKYQAAKNRAADEDAQKQEEKFVVTPGVILRQGAAHEHWMGKKINSAFIPKDVTIRGYTTTYGVVEGIVYTGRLFINAQSTHRLLETSSRQAHAQYYVQCERLIVVDGLPGRAKNFLSVNDRIGVHHTLVGQKLTPSSMVDDLLDQVMKVFQGDEAREALAELETIKAEPEAAPAPAPKPAPFSMVVHTIEIEEETPEQRQKRIVAEGLTKMRPFFEPLIKEALDQQAEIFKDQIFSLEAKIDQLLTSRTETPAPMSSPFPKPLPPGEKPRIRVAVGGSPAPLLTYEEMAERFDVKVTTARSLTRRHGWRKYTDGQGSVRVRVPDEYLAWRDNYMSTQH